jgi:hypothetical protein
VTFFPKRRKKIKSYLTMAKEHNFTQWFGLKVIKL